MKSHAVEDQELQMTCDQVILVDENDNQIGTCNKYDAHRTDLGAKLHRAFSLFLFEPKEGRLLLQKRSEYKLTFPLIWANTCCSHPSPNEDVISASKRRSKFELNIDINKISDLKEVGVFLYKAPWNEWTEYEIDHVIFGNYNIDTSTENVDFNKSEVSEVKWVTSSELAHIIENEPDTLSPWLKKIYKQWLALNWESWVSNKTIANSTSTIVRL